MKRMVRWQWVTLGLLVSGCGDISPLGSGSLMDSGVSGSDAGRKLDASVRPDSGTSVGTPRDGGAASEKDSPSRSDANIVVTHVDAGYYRGDGSFFVEGGAYGDAATSSDASTQGASDGGGVDATPGCAPLAACCSSLQSASQSLCTTIAAAGNATNCSTELTQLQGAGDCTGVSVLASQVQVPPILIVSDGTLLFWATAESPSLLAMPVHGGEITTLLEGAIDNTGRHIYASGIGPFLAVDDVNVYLFQYDEILRIPKDGTAATVISEPGGNVIAVAAIGDTAYWLEDAEHAAYGFSPQALVAVESAPLLGGPITDLGTFESPAGYPSQFAVTSNATFLLGSQGLYSIPMSPTGMPWSLVQGATCTSMASDTDAVYCAQTTGSNLRIANDGTITPLGSAVSSSLIVSDDTYAYWADATAVGTIMKAPKAGGGTAVVLARDANPTAIAVDATSVYWGDQAGYIKSVPK